MIINKNSKVIWFAVLVVIIFTLPYYILGRDSLLIIGDNMDGCLPAFSRLVKSNNYFSFSSTAYVDFSLNGELQRNLLYSPFNIDAILFYLLDPFRAYAGILILVHLVAFLGMFLFLSDVVKFKNIWIVVIVSFAYTFLPKYYLFGGAVYSSFPLLFWSLRQFLQSGIKYLLILPLGIALFGSMAISNIFYAAVIFSWYLLNLRDIRHVRFYTFFSVFIIGFLLNDIGLFIQLTQGKLNLARPIPENLPISAFSINTFFQSFLNNLTASSINECKSAHWLSVCILLPFAVLRYKTIKEVWANKEIRRLYLVLVLFVLFFSPLWMSNKQVIGNYLPNALKGFDFSRFSSLRSFFWYWTIGLIIYYCCDFENKYLKYLKYLLITIVISFVIRNNELWKANTINVLNLKIAYRNLPELNRNNNVCGFNDFYCPDLFDLVKEDLKDKGINKDSCRFASIGYTPGITLFNGFNCIDGYYSAFSLDYYYKFCKALECNGNNEWYKGFPLRSYFINDSIISDWNYKDGINFHTRPLNEFKFCLDEINNNKPLYIFSTCEIISGNLELINGYSSRIKQPGRSIDKLYLYYFRHPM